MIEGDSRGCGVPPAAFGVDYPALVRGLKDPPEVEKYLGLSGARFIQSGFFRLRIVSGPGLETPHKLEGPVLVEDASGFEVNDHERALTLLDGLTTAVARQRIFFMGLPFLLKSSV